MRERFETYLKEAIGLDAASVGSGTVERAIRERAGACGCPDTEAYWLFLNETPSERQKLIEAVVVPETWFFRDPAAFAALVQLAASRQKRAASQRPLKVLSAPCSTGEEPYSIAMALLDAGIEPQRFAIDAIDVSVRAIEHAQAARYRKNSFRGGDQGFRDRYFGGDRVCDAVRACVQFRRANLLELDAAGGDARYDAVFCRNLLIYFDRATQDRAIAVLTRVLAEDGVLFVGPSEGGLLISHGFESMSWPMAFGFRRPPARAAARTRAKAGGRASPGRAYKPHAAPQAAAPAPRGRAAKAIVAQARSGGGASDLLSEAQALADRGEAAAARECCERAIRASGPSAQAFYLLGLLHDAAGEAARAIEHYRRAVYLDPHHHEALVHLAVLVEGEGDSVAAQRFYDRAKRASARGERA